MADLEKHQDREDWLRWAVEFMTRGLWADDLITVHGPHTPPADCMWGNAEAWIDGADMGAICVFTTPRAIRGRHDVQGVRISSDSGERFPILKASELTPKARRWLRAARTVLKRLGEQRRGGLNHGSLQAGKRLLV